jgi:hypothetical protein
MQETTDDVEATIRTLFPQTEANRNEIRVVSEHDVLNTHERQYPENAERNGLLSSYVEQQQKYAHITCTPCYTLIDTKDYGLHSLRPGSAIQLQLLWVFQTACYRGKEGGGLRRQRKITLLSKKTLYFILQKQCRRHKLYKLTL